MVNRNQKITLGEMREMGVRGLLIDCLDYKCSRWAAITGDRWADDARLSDLEPLFVCQTCGRRGADVRPNFHWGGRGSAREGPRRAVLRPLSIPSVFTCASTNSTRASADAAAGLRDRRAVHRRG